MNARQAARAAAKVIEGQEKMIKDLEHYNAMCKRDVTAYNKVIEGMIAGESPCPWCEEHPDCQHEEKDGKGCSDWWLKFDVEVEDPDGGEQNEGENFLSGCPACGE